MSHEKPDFLPFFLLSPVEAFVSIHLTVYFHMQSSAVDAEFVAVELFDLNCLCFQTSTG